ncbi:Hypothetical predicted protein [Olea europaea subsp. europaea]|uniref:Retrotransposon Copia-like N-terminal domain-containing protein n=1 Tax=Olea europaea subsp. europaea TaxID=158383 RepID=A0A8S0QH35_OLEEU|nr:Hypothetical predicted protein [Olea europaea subsp. europaea]
MATNSDVEIEVSTNNSSLKADNRGEDLIIAAQRMISDPASPYYVHYGDNTGMQIVSIMLSDENYSTWSRAVEMALSVKNKEGFIDGSLSRPSVDSPLYAAWHRCNHNVSSWIINSIPKELYPSVMHKESSREIWPELKGRYSQGNGPRIYYLKKLIASITQGNGFVSAYFNRLKGQWEELSNYRPQTHNPYYEEEQILQFLMGLDECYSNVRSQILLMEPLPTLNKVFTLVQQDER